MLNMDGIVFDDFYFNGKWLSYYGGSIAGKNGLSPFSVLPDIELKTEKVIGIDGEIVYGKSYNPRTFTIPVVFNDIKRIREIAGWLNVSQPTDFYLKNDTVKLKVMFSSAIEFEHYAYQGVVELKFIAHDPYFTEITQTPIVYTSGLGNLNYITISGNVECYPLIKFTGNGDITFEVNGDRYRIKNVIDYVYMDCYYYTIYKGDPSNGTGITKLQDFYKVNISDGTETYPTKMPVFTTGTNSNTIKLISGTCTEIRVTNRNRWI